MSNESTRSFEEPAGELSTPAGFETRLRGTHRGLLAVGGAYLLTLLFKIAIGIGYNWPGGPLPGANSLFSVTATLTPFVLSIGVALVGVTIQQRPVRIGLLFAGVFGGLAVLNSAALWPALGSIGVALAIITYTVYYHHEGLLQVVLTAGFSAGIGLTLASAVGIIPRDVLVAGQWLFLGTIIAYGVSLSWHRLTVAAVGGTIIAIAIASVANPFVFGSALLQSFEIVGVPAGLVAIAFGVGMGVVVEALRQQRYPIAIGMLIVVFAGAPANIASSLAVIVGMSMLFLSPLGTAKTELAPNGWWAQ